MGEGSCFGSVTSWCSAGVSSEVYEGASNAETVSLFLFYSSLLLFEMVGMRQQEECGGA